jgi:hypothetical protein
MTAETKNEFDLEKLVYKENQLQRGFVMRLFVSCSN